MKYPWFHLGGSICPTPFARFSSPLPPLCNLFAYMHTTITLYVTSSGGSRNLKRFLKKSRERNLLAN